MQCVYEVSHERQVSLSVTKTKCFAVRVAVCVAVCAAAVRAAVCVAVCVAVSVCTRQT